MTPDLEKLERQLTALRNNLDEARARRHEQETTLSELDEQRQAAEARLALAERESADLEQRLKAQQAEVETARTEAAVSAYEDALKAKDAKAEEIAEDIDALLGKLDNLDRDLLQLGEMQKALAARRVKVVVSPEPDAFIEAWQRLASLVRQTLDEQLEDELIEAAVRSPRSRAIDELPDHLREAARQRQRSRPAARRSAQV